MKIQLIIFSILGMANMALAADARPVIEIPNRVEISQRQDLNLAQVAIVKNGTAELLKILDSCVITGDARQFLLKPTVKGDTLIACYKEQILEDAALRKLNPQLRIPSEVTLEFSKTQISRREVERLVQNQLQTTCDTCQFNVSVMSTPVFEGKRWNLDLGNLPDRGGLMIPVTDEVGAGNKKWITGQISVQKLTPVLVRTVSQGERLAKSDIKYIMKDATTVTAGALAGEDVQGLISNRYLGAGQPVTSADIHREPIVKKGQILKAMAGNSQFEVSLSVEALDNGFEGEILKVKATESQKMLSGKVDAQGVVRLQQ